MGETMVFCSCENNTCTLFLICFPSFSTRAICHPPSLNLSSSSCIILSSNYIFFCSNSSIACRPFFFFSNFNSNFFCSVCSNFCWSFSFSSFSKIRFHSLRKNCFFPLPTCLYFLCRLLVF